MIDILKDLATGIYHLSKIDVELDWQSLESNQGWKVFRLDGSSITSTEEYLKNLAHLLHSPEYCTENLDAMLNCLRLLPVYNPGAYRYVILYTDYNIFRLHDKQQFDLSLEILRYAVSTWQEKRPDLRLNIILIGNESELPEFVQIL